MVTRGECQGSIVHNVVSGARTVKFSLLAPGRSRCAEVLFLELPDGEIITVGAESQEHSAACHECFARVSTTMVCHKTAGLGRRRMLYLCTLRYQPYLRRADLVSACPALDHLTKTALFCGGTEMSCRRAPICYPSRAGSSVHTLRMSSQSGCHCDQP